MIHHYISILGENPVFSGQHLHIPHQGMNCNIPLLSSLLQYHSLPIPGERHHNILVLRMLLHESADHTEFLP